MAAPSIFLRTRPLLLRVRFIQQHNIINNNNNSNRLFSCVQDPNIIITSSPSPSPSPSPSSSSQPTVFPQNNTKWLTIEAQMLRDIQPIIFLTKQILHSDRYMDGELLTPEDEKVVMENLLAHHPHSVDKIGCGLDSIMVDRHPQFRNSRCLFVVRTDGGWIDFSYQKCLRAYIREKYPSYAEKFIKKHFKRSSS